MGKRPKPTVTIAPVLMCGGAATRLWPLSREAYPKQFLAVRGELSLFQHTAKRIESGAYLKEEGIVRIEDVYERA